MDKQAQIRSQTVGLLSMLGVQFILGMVLNAFIKIPKVHPGTTGGYVTRSVHGFGWAVSDGGGFVLLLHVIVAIGLLVGSVTLLIRAISMKSQAWIIAAVIGFLGILAALTNGLAFLGYDKDANSFVMAMGFFFAATSYSTALSIAERKAWHAGRAKHSTESEDDDTRTAHRLRTSHG